MSYTQLTRKNVKIKKAHRCFMCNIKYETPTKMTYTFGVNDGEMQSVYSCEVCESFMTPELWKDCDYEMAEGDIWNFEEYEEFRKNKLNQNI